LRTEKNSLQTKLDTKTLEAQRLEAARGEAGHIYSPRTEDVRANCLGAQKAMDKRLTGLMCNFKSDLPFVQTDAEAQLRVEQTWIAAHVIAARALDVIERMRAESPVPLPERVMGQHVLTPDEAARWLADAQLIENAESAAQVLAEQAPVKRGRGRPRKDEAKS
jgi:hypothetical protein